MADNAGDPVGVRFFLKELHNSHNVSVFFNLYGDNEERVSFINLKGRNNIINFPTDLESIPQEGVITSIGMLGLSRKVYEVSETEECARARYKNLSRYHIEKVIPYRRSNTMVKGATR